MKITVFRVFPLFDTFRTPPESDEIDTFPKTDRKRDWFFDKMTKMAVLTVFHENDHFWTLFRPLFHEN